jgi:hypothetical protein
LSAKLSQAPTREGSSRATAAVQERIRTSTSTSTLERV